MSLLRLSGFTKPRSLTYFFIFTLTFSIFSFTQSSNVRGGRLRPYFPGEFVAFREGFMRLVKDIHLWSVLPAGTLLPLQFLPAVRRKYVNLHRWSGRLLFLLLLLGSSSAIGIAHNSFGGTLETRIWVYTLGSMEAYALIRSWIAIRQGKIAEHRVWAIRTWGWVGSVLTMRFFMGFFYIYMLFLPTNTIFYSVTTCSKLHRLYTTNPYPLISLHQNYPQCEEIFTEMSDPQIGAPRDDIYVAVQLGRYPPERRVAIANMAFGTAGWLATVIHMFAVEWWLSWSEGKARNAQTAAKREGL